METRVDVAVIGAGTAGLYAHKEATRVTDKVALIDRGPYGTTCARVGCMPSKVLLQAADDFHRRHHLREVGITGAEALKVDSAAVMSHLRTLRDLFVSGVLRSVKAIGENNIQGFARFVEPTVLEVDGRIVRAEAVIIATGSRPVLPQPWLALGDRITTSDGIFELQRLPESMAVIGAGAIGLELGQALCRLGVRVSAFDLLNTVGGLSDPEVSTFAVEQFGKELPLHLGEAVELEDEDGRLRVRAQGGGGTFEMALASLGRRPNLDGMGLEQIGVALDKRGVPVHDPDTLQVGKLPIYIAGDANGEHPLMHEAADDGRVAGYNAVHRPGQRFARRAPLRIAFTDPNLAVAGKSFAALEGREIAVGEARFEVQGRSLIMGRNAGILRVYADPESGKLLGCEMLAPAGEHLAHLLAWSIQNKMTVQDALRMPFYHPVVEEGLREALVRLASKLGRGRPPTFELAVAEP